MSLSIDPPIDRPVSRFDFYLRPIALTLLMVAEIFFFTLRFDPPTDLPKDLWWALPLSSSRGFIRFILLFSVAVSAFGGLRLAYRLRRGFFQDLDKDYPWQRCFLAHGVSLVIMAALTAFVCEGKLLVSSHPGAWMTAWVGSVLATGSTWLAMMLSPSAWLEILKRNRRAIVVGFVVAGSAFLLGNYTGTLWGTMAGATMTLAEAILRLVTSQAICNPETRIMELGSFKVRIGDPCSGYEGIGLVLAFLAGYFWFFRRSLRWPQTYYLFAVGSVLIWLLNAVRIALLVLIGGWVSPTVAFGGFHSQAGWLSFLMVSLGLVAISRRSSWFVADPEIHEVARRSNPSLAFLGPFLVVLASALVSGAMSSGFDAFYGLRVFTGALALWYFRREFAGLILNGTWAGVAIGVLAFGIWVALEPASTGAGRALAAVVGEMPKDRAWAWIALRVIGSVAIIPLVEELAFRGYLIRRLSSADFQSVPLGRFAWLPLLISSAAFGLLHGRWLAGMLVGVLYGLALYRRGKLGDAILAHAVTNALIAGTVLMTGDWTMWI